MRRESRATQGKLCMSTFIDGAHTHTHTHTHTHKRIFKCISFGMAQVGRNGIGKSTLLSHISHYAVPGIPQGFRICHVHQEAPADHRSCVQVVYDSDVELYTLRKRCVVSPYSYTLWVNSGPGLNGHTGQFLKCFALMLAPQSDTRS